MGKKPAIGICDLGASGGKIFISLIDDDALRVKEIYRFQYSPQKYFQSNLRGKKLVQRLCWDFNWIFKEIISGLKKIASLEEIELKSFGVDSWGSDGAWITGDGDMLGIIGTGRDLRWQQARCEILAKINAEELFRLTGVQSYPFNVLNQIYWYTKYQPDLVKAAAIYMPINSLVYYYLTGEIIAEYTWMSTTQLCKAGKAEYHEKIFELLGLSLKKMPCIVKPGTSIGSCHVDIANQIGLNQFEVVVPATHDTACAYVAADIAGGRKTMIISTGTWFLVGIKKALQ